MKKLTFIFAAIALICLFSCSNEEDYVGYVEHAQKNYAKLTESGYLEFPTTESFADYIKNYDEGKKDNNLYMSTRSNGKGFESLADMERRVQNARTRVGNDDSYSDTEELEEMTIDEYNLMKAEELLFDNILTHLVDTTLRICVEGRLYKVTKDGTFSVDIKDNDYEMAEKAINKAVGGFNNTLKTTTPSGGSTQLDNGILFTNTFGFQNVTTEVAVTEPLTPLYPSNPGNPTPGNDDATAGPTESDFGENIFHEEYNVESYKWKSKTALDKFLDWLRGKDVVRTNNFTKNRRIKVNVFDVNYAFYASAGVKVKMQKRKKFLGIPYWVNTEADKLAIGFNNLEGIMHYNNPKPFNSIMPTTGAGWDAFKGTLNGITSDFIYGSYHNLDFIKDWTDDIVTLLPVIILNDQSWTDKVCNKLYNTPPSLVISFLKKQLIGKHIYDPIERQIKYKDPMMAYFVWGSSTEKFDKEHPFIMGVKEYANISSKSVIFDRSFGFSFTGNLIMPFLPTNFDIKKLDVFGAAHYDGRWLGVRFTN